MENKHRLIINDAYGNGRIEGLLIGFFAGITLCLVVAIIVYR